jgi:hypothetical protein
MSMSPTLKNAIRHVMYKSGLAALHIKLRQAHGYDLRHLSETSLPERFTAIYRRGVWLMGRDSGSLSGIGSEMKHTENIRRQLPDLLHKIGTGTLLDLGCGDFNWMKEVPLACSYIGADIVPEVIRSNSGSFANDKYDFKCLDATKESLPSADTILCREVLFHLSFEDIWKVISNVLQSDASHLIATSDNAVHINADILSGDYRPLNLQKPPFLLPQPVFSVRDDSVVPDRILAAWQLDDMRQSLRGDPKGDNSELAANVGWPRD